MTQVGNSTETLDRATEAQEEDLRRKIPVTKLAMYGRDAVSIWLAEDVQRTHRAELADIRWLLKVEKQRGTELDTRRVAWKLGIALLRQFEEYFDFQETFEVVIERARQEAEERKRKAEEESRRIAAEMREESLREYQELCTRHVPNPSQVKVRVIRCNCDEPYLYRQMWLEKEAPRIYEIRIELAKEGTPQELEARKQLAKLFTEDKKKYHIEGVGYKWRMDEHTLSAYSDWMILPCPMEEEIERWEREGERKPESKIKIEKIYQDWTRQLNDEYWVEFNYCDVSGALRKAIRTYRHKHQSPSNMYLFVRTDGARWNLTSEILYYFESWFELSEPMSVLLAKAKKRAEQIRKERASEYSYYSSFNPFGQMHAQSKRESELNNAFSSLGLSRTATQEDVKRKYRQLAKQYHPDTGGDAEKFKQINHANQVLMQHLG